MKIVGISGSQGGGKTSILDELQSRGFFVNHFKVSRSVQQDLGWSSLDKATESVDTMKMFQNLILESKYKNDAAIVAHPSDDIVLVERTFADIWAYTALWAQKLIGPTLNIENVLAGDLSSAANSSDLMTMVFLKEYHEKCVVLQSLIYTGTILVPLADHIEWQEDPHRAKKEDAPFVFSEVERIVKKASVQPHSPAFTTITEKSVIDRADEVEKFIRSLP